MKNAIFLAVALLVASPVAAQHAHGNHKGPNGGAMEDVAGVHVEFLSTGTNITLNVFDEDNKPVATAGFTASALVVHGAERETLTLLPKQPNGLAGDAKKPVAPGAAVSITLKTATGKTGQARFRK